MAMLIKYCEGCGERVSTEDLDRESAVIYKELAYCRKCKVDVLALMEQERGNKAKRSTISAPAVSRPVSSSGIRRSSGTVQAKIVANERRKPNTQNSSLILGLVIGSGILFLLILFFLFSGNSTHSKDSTDSSSENIPSKTEKKDPPKKDPKETKTPPNKEDTQEAEETKNVQAFLASIKNVDYLFAKEKILKQQSQVFATKNKEILDTILAQLTQQHEQEAQRYFEDLKKRVDSEILEKALKSITPSYANTKFNEAEKLWEMFPPLYKDTKYWEMRDDEIARIKRERETKRGNGRSTEENKSIPIDFGTNKDFALNPREGDWNFDKQTGLISVKTQEKEGRLDIGEKAVQNFTLTFEFKSDGNATKGEIKVLSHVPETKGVKHFALILTTGPADNKWNRIQLTYQEPIYSFNFNNETPQTLDGEKEKFSKIGRILLTCSPESSFQFRNLEIKTTP